MSNHLKPVNQMPLPELQTNLQRLQRELKELAPSDPEQAKRIKRRRRRQSEPYESVANQLPIGHSCSTEAFKGICESQYLLCQSVLSSGAFDNRKSKVSTEQRLGTDGYVFLYVGALRYRSNYRPTGAGLLFSVGLEKQDSNPPAIAHPFDCGGIAKIYFAKAEDDTQREILRSYSLPVPEYRKLLSLCLQLLFTSPDAYIDGSGPDVEGFFPSDGDSRRWTFETKFPERVELREALITVFVSRSIALQPWFRSVYEIVTNGGNKVELIPGSSTDFRGLDRAASTFITKLLGESK